MAENADEERVSKARPGAREVVRAALAPVVSLAEEFGGHVLLAGQVFFWLFRRPFRARLFVHAMDFVGVQSLFIVGLTGTFSGMVLAVQSVYGFRKFAAESMVGGVVALSLVREISPVFAGLMTTSRAGSAMATELGTMRVTDQIDALATIAVNPIQYLVVPRVVAGALMLPILCLVFTLVGLAGAYVIAVGSLGVDPGIFMDRVRDYVKPKDLTEGLVKAAVFGYVMALIACKQGFAAKGGAAGVGVATTRAVVYSAVSILVLDYVLTRILTPV